MNRKSLFWAALTFVVALVNSSCGGQSSGDSMSFALFAGDMRGASSIGDTGTAARFNNPSSVATDSLGNIYVADSNNHTIRKITPAGVVTTFAGRAGVSGSVDGTGADARFKIPFGIATDSAGNVYVADRNNHIIRKITPVGVVTTLAGSADLPGNADGVCGAARFSFPTGVATDSDGNVYVADRTNHIRKITPACVVSTIVGVRPEVSAARVAQRVIN